MNCLWLSRGLFCSFCFCLKIMHCYRQHTALSAFGLVSVMVLCSTLSWLNVSFWTHINYVASYNSSNSNGIACTLSTECKNYSACTKRNGKISMSALGQKGHDVHIWALLINHKDDITSVGQQHSDHETGQTDRQTPDWCFMLSTKNVASITVHINIRRATNLMVHILVRQHIFNFKKARCLT